MATNTTTNGNGSNSFQSLENRQAPSPIASHAGGQLNGNGMNGAGYMPPLPVGHQQDLNFLYQQIQELSGILKDNRDKVKGITGMAEEVAVSYTQKPCLHLLIYLLEARWRSGKR